MEIMQIVLFRGYLLLNCTSFFIIVHKVDIIILLLVGYHVSNPLKLVFIYVLQFFQRFVCIITHLVVIFTKLY